MLKTVAKELWRDSLAAYTGYRVVLHIVAVIATVLIVLSGLDWYFYESTRSTFWHPIVWIAGIGGFYAPVVFPIAVYAWGEWSKHPHLRNAGIAIMRAVVVACVIVAIYKVFSGRMQPEFIYTIGTEDISHQFQFGFLRHGIFWGWPSSHTAVAVAGALTAVAFFRGRFVRLMLFAYMLIIALGAAIGFHWLSDVLAGAFVGGAVAWGIIARSGTIRS